MVVGRMIRGPSSLPPGNSCDRNQGVGVPGPQCRLCGAELRATFVDLGMSPLCESYVSAERLDGPRIVLPASCAYLPRVPAGATAGLRRRGGDLLRLPLLLVLLRFLGRSRQALRRPHDRRARARARTHSSRRWRATTATCCSTSWPTRGAGRRHRAGGERRRGRPGARGAHRGLLPRRRDRRRGRRPVRPGRPGRREQRLRPRAGHPRLQRRAGRAGRTARAGDPGVPAPAAADRAPRSTTRSTTSTTSTCPC